MWAAREFNYFLSQQIHFLENPPKSDPQMLSIAWMFIVTLWLALKRLSSHKITLPILISKSLYFDFFVGDGNITIAEIIAPNINQSSILISLSFLCWVVALSG